MPIKRRHALALAASLVIGTLYSGPALADWPQGPVTMIVPWGAGGGTDATARMIANLLQKQLGVPVPVVNRTGGSGVVGHSAIADAAADGSTIGIATLEIGTMHHLGLTELDYKAYAPIGLYNSDPAAIFVRADSDYGDIKTLLEALSTAQDREFKASGSALGGVNHLAVAGMLAAAGLPVDRIAWVPSEGAAPGLQDLAAGGVAIATASMPEAEALTQAGRIKPLAVFASDRLAKYPDVPTLEEATGHAFTMGSWRGVVAPAEIPQDVADKLTEAVKAVVNDPAYLSFMEERGYATQWTPGEEFSRFMATSDATLGQTLQSVGLAK
ncbi:MAG: tripartite tricarboxylate transporter substrate binding protein [Alphaproteobacteria bacterium]|jgi:tripartite-type tricarboxylate transporter receptor subunit TctC|nr:tripartite tricarboxylate transporter substrate binding protein [Alphaproteobacteria bacterium]MBU1551374.1 tripartite tricarboxylate transporter substrate binding protein [Alphaproteobacteria bacterium]MBU2336527.1 tripartite tricarboxylate transporter substrate binding protein [Alphaproteobacteria bacterium]MBU2387941.1 tripartite tricarboxylate transporter substrate binding protein [Alphaproteobacteria bacterium]